jgi:hypothetical protein
MRNVILLQTDKPSRGIVFFNGTYRIEKGLINYPKEIYPSSQGFDIYITNNEDLVLGGYHFNSKYGDEPQKTVQRDIDSRKYWEEEDYIISKIVVTSDQDLIEQDIQALTDEQIMEYINNPVDYVEVVKEVQAFDGLNRPITNAVLFDDYTKDIYSVSFSRENGYSEIQKESLKANKEFVDKTDRKDLNKLMSEFDNMYTEEQVLKMLEYAVHESRMQDDKAEYHIVNETIFEFKINNIC